MTFTIKLVIQDQIETLEHNIAELNDEINDKQKEIDSFEYECSDDEFCDWIDSIYPDVNIGSLTFSPSDIMMKLDPVAYRCAKSDYECDYDLDDIEEYNELKDELEILEYKLELLEAELDVLTS